MFEAKKNVLGKKSISESTVSAERVERIGEQCPILPKQKADGGVLSIHESRHYRILCCEERRVILSRLGGTHLSAC